MERSLAGKFWKGRRITDLLFFLLILVAVLTGLGRPSESILLNIFYVIYWKTEGFPQTGLGVRHKTCYMGLVLFSLALHFLVCA